MALDPLTDFDAKLQVPLIDPKSPWGCGDVEFPIAEKMLAKTLDRHAASRKSYDKSFLISTKEAWDTKHGHCVDHEEPYSSSVKFDVPCLELGRHCCQNCIFYGPTLANAPPPLFTRLDKALASMIGPHSVNTLGVQPMYYFADAAEPTRSLLAVAISHLKSPFSAEFILLDLPITDLLEWQPANDGDLIATVRRERHYGFDVPSLRTDTDLSRLAHRLCCGRAAELIWFKISYEHLSNWRFKILSLDAVDLDRQVAEEEAAREAAQASALLHQSLAGPRGRGRGGGRRQGAGRGLGRGRGRGGGRGLGRGRGRGGGRGHHVVETEAEEVVEDLPAFDCEVEQLGASVAEPDAAEMWLQALHEEDRAVAAQDDISELGLPPEVEEEQQDGGQRRAQPGGKIRIRGLSLVRHVCFPMILFLTLNCARRRNKRLAGTMNKTMIARHC